MPRPKRLSEAVEQLLGALRRSGDSYARIVAVRSVQDAEIARVFLMGASIEGANAWVRDSFPVNAEASLRRHVNRRRVR